MSFEHLVKKKKKKKSNMLNFALQSSIWHVVIQLKEKSNIKTELQHQNQLVPLWKTDRTQFSLSQTKIS